MLLWGEVHEGICGTHQSAPKMKWLLRRAGFYWPSIISDCFRHYKGCEECHRFGDIQLVPTALLHPIIKPWLFRGWGLDFIGQINPSSSKGHRFVLVATDYFTKCTEAVPLKNMTHREVIEFLTKIKILNSSLYYAQANGQAESSNKILIKLIKKKCRRKS